MFNKVATRMVSVGKLEPFEDGPQEWASYVERFEQFLFANDITEAKKVMATFLTAVGAKTYELLKDIVAPAKPSEPKFEEVVEHLNKHYDPKPLVIAERFKFHKLTSGRINRPILCGVAKACFDLPVWNVFR